MENITPPLHESLVNPEHARLELIDYMGNLNDTTALITRITKALIDIKNPPPKDAPLKAIVHTDEGQTLFKESLFHSVKSITQKYLNDALTREEKRIVFRVIQALFAALPADKPVPPQDDQDRLDESFFVVGSPDPFLLGCKTQLKQQIQDMIETHRAAIIAKSETLHAEIIQANRCVNDDFLHRLQKCFHQAKELIEDYPLLNTWVSPLQRMGIEPLIALNKRIIESTGHLLQQSNYQLSHQPTGSGDEFYNLIKNHATMLAIIERLLQRTAQYSELLLVEARQCISDDILLDIDGKLPTHLEAPPGSTYDTIKTKFNITHELRQILNNEVVAPNERIRAFGERIEATNQILRIARQRDWIDFAKSCAALVAIVLTGIIPGMAYLRYTGKSLFFNQQNAGKAYLEEAEAISKPKP